MSNNEPDLDLEKMFLPAWAKETPAANRFSHFTGEEGARPGRRGDFRSPGRGGRREGGPPRDQDRRPGSGRPLQRDDQARRRGGDDRGRPGQRFPDRRRDEERQPEIPLPEIQVGLVVEEKSADSLARQIRITGRSYPIFDISFMIVQKPERYQLTFSVVKKADGQIAQPLYLCALDDTLWLSEAEAMDYALERHFNMFYQAERTATTPPKGVYTFVAQCGFSGAILGPPNYHGYQDQLRKLHAERFSRMPFEAYKSRVRIVRDEAVVKKWLEDQSWKTEYICLNVPESPRLANRESVAQHFRETHLATIIRTVESHTLNAAVALNLRSPGLRRLVRRVIEDQRRFPLKLVTHLSQQFAARGLQFFKRDKAVIHVAVARPHYLDLETSVVSDGVKRIIEFINANPKCTRPKLIEALAPTPVKPVEIPVTPAPPVEAAAPAEGAPATVPAEGAPATPPAPPAKPEAPEPTAEQLVVISDLHWLVHQGHVIELANGLMETAKKPLPRPPKPAPATAAKPATEAQAQNQPGTVAAETTAMEGAGTAAAEPVLEAAPAAEALPVPAAVEIAPVPADDTKPEEAPAPPAP